MARQLLRDERLRITISAQVASEVIVSIIRHAALNEPEIRELILRFYSRYTVEPITESLQLEASRLRERYALSFWDSLIVSAALQSGATSLYSEDMQNGLMVSDRLMIVNPFADLARALR